jgi:transcriptional regulator GlxA family with amidase domain
MSFKQTSVGILIFPNVEVLDFCGPFEVFSVTRINPEDGSDPRSPYTVHLVAETDEPVSARGGLRVLPTCTIDSCPPLDILVVPGGWGTREAAANPRLMAWIRERGGAVPLLTSVCTGSLLLAGAGLLSGRRATSHWAALDDMAAAYPDVDVVYDEHVTVDGHVVTSAGISAGIDMALRVVAATGGEPLARATARRMEYPYPDDNSRRVDVQPAH